MKIDYANSLEREVCFKQNMKYETLFVVDFSLH